MLAFAARIFASAAWFKEDEARAIWGSYVDLGLPEVQLPSVQEWTAVHSIVNSFVGFVAMPERRCRVRFGRTCCPGRLDNGGDAPRWPGR